MPFLTLKLRCCLGYQGQEKFTRKGTTDIFSSNTQNQWHLEVDSTVQFNISVIVLLQFVTQTHSCHWRELRKRVLVKGYKRKKKDKKKRRRKKKKKQSSSQVRSRSNSSKRQTCSSRINTCRGWEESSWILEGWGVSYNFLKKTKQGRCCNPFFLNYLCFVITNKTEKIFLNIILHFCFTFVAYNIIFVKFSCFNSQFLALLFMGEIRMAYRSHAEYSCW